MKNLIEEIEKMETQAEALRTVKVVIDHMIELHEQTLKVLKSCQKIIDEH